uniref:Uncharacterized protein n=1 Tax=Opuntia streptacantha TaxID=393608 RepID=A0A7C9D883_OPUST
MAITLLILFLFLSPPFNIISLPYSSTRSGLVGATRPLGSSFKNDYVALAPQLPGSDQSTGGFTEKELDACMPKGFRRNSAPSRYVNYHTLGVSTLCSNGKN